MPPNAYEAKKTLSDLGLEYTKYHSCPNNCILYRGVNVDASECPKCRLSRWKLGKDGKIRINVPAKVMWYFPIIPRFKRMFKSPSTSELMTWHSKQRIEDGKMRHPADSPSWEEGEPNVYDAYTKSYFTLKAILLWTINDFPAYGNLSGCVNKGYMCCPVCVDDTVAKYLSHSRKMCYQGHRRYLARNHPYRKQKAAFNGQQELGQARQPLSGEEVLLQQDKIKFQFGKEVSKSKKVDCPWKKKSVFFELEYWKFHHVRHCLDVMHVEKNVCDSLIGTLLNMKSKSKDSEASRLDMIDMGVRADLAPQKGEKKPTYPPSIFNLSKAEKKKMLSSLMHMKLPYTHASNIKNCVSMEELKMFGIKSHDCHILLQQLLPIAIRAELRLCGPVFYRWMYAFERFNKVLKSYVHNRYYPEGCIAECYLGEESVEFCQVFVKQACTTAGLHKDEGKLSGPLSVVTMKSIDEKERDEAHLHVLLNNIEVQPYILMHKEYLEGIHQGKKKSVHWLLREHNRLFADWFLEKVSYSEMEENLGGVSETMRWIAGKPSFSVLTYEAYLVDGVRYFTKERDGVRVVQNSGVSLVAKTVQVSSAKDLNPVESDLTFYGVILEIWELDYHAFKAQLFLCNWADNDKGIKVDDLGFTLVDLSRQGHKRDKYVSMDQVKQVYYIEDPVDAKWSVVLTSTTRDYQDVYNDDDLGDTTMENPPFFCQIPICDVGEDVEKNIRENIKGSWVKK
ncbi:uncharacterized protein LOC141676833 [Apium graveolens]|uniref:uncharacterized protein LOC141676833 n=1 Tax=Apium graveolens TaxID=4045 RepID=UPI003D7A6F00